MFLNVHAGLAVPLHSFGISRRLWHRVRSYLAHRQKSPTAGRCHGGEFKDTFVTSWISSERRRARWHDLISPVSQKAAAEDGGVAWCSAVWIIRFLLQAKGCVSYCICSATKLQGCTNVIWWLSRYTKLNIQTWFRTNQRPLFPLYTWQTSIRPTSLSREAVHTKHDDNSSLFQLDVVCLYFLQLFTISEVYASIIKFFSYFMKPFVLTAVLKSNCINKTGPLLTWYQIDVVIHKLPSWKLTLK